MPSLKNQSFVDGVTLLSKTKEDPQDALDKVDPLLRLSDQILNVSKTHVSTLTQVISVFCFWFPWSTIGAQGGAKHSKLKLRIR